MTKVCGRCGVPLVKYEAGYYYEIDTGRRWITCAHVAGTPEHFPVDPFIWLAQKAANTLEDMKTAW